ncbi:MAG: hypothetical protein CVV13_08205 [Gammaproteobacteria bacterium HGW-Gammaproteobacteria-3]|nr:MAG: hypothetical protein CVV13_08205 [Gammaproteobacteria bacterium HGW-Gammaproteobacteria-3]
MSHKEIDSEHQKAGIDKKRRALAKAGISTPVIASLLSRPAFAAQCSGSALASGNLSNPVDLTTCGACLSSQWLKATPTELDLIGIALEDTIDTLFTIPTLTRPTNSVGQPILSGSLGDALKGTIQINSNLGFSNTSGNINGAPNIANARTQLQQAFTVFTAAYLNASHRATQVNFDPTPQDVETSVSDALTLTDSGGSDRINIDSVNTLANTFSTAIGDGGSCSINRTL